MRRSGPAGVDARSQPGPVPDTTAVAAAGDVDRAEDLARSITNPNQRAQALAGLARTVAAGGDVDRAERLARSITDPNQHVQALESVARIAEPVRARRLIAEIVHRGRWTVPLDALTRVEPVVLTTISDEILGLAD